MSDFETCYECGEQFDPEEEGDGDVCDECVAIARDPDTLMHCTISNETIERVSDV